MIILIPKIIIFMQEAVVYPEISKSLIDKGIKYINDLPGQEQKNTDLFDVIGPEVRKRGYMKRDEFLKLAMWKSPRPKPHYLKNTEADINEVTS
ncbi:MAG: hypothetical protein INQ03_03565 [Candidatus Heimdallarchaeota archaeon]|nr:hypothetical protein [Candidatus Heimdallarchaeota archaeon]